MILVVPEPVIDASPLQPAPGIQELLLNLRKLYVEKPPMCNSLGEGQNLKDVDTFSRFSSL